MRLCMDILVDMERTFHINGKPEAFPSGFGTEPRPLEGVPITFNPPDTTTCMANFRSHVSAVFFGKIGHMPRDARINYRATRILDSNNHILLLRRRQSDMNELNCQFLCFVQSEQREWTGISAEFSSVQFCHCEHSFKRRKVLYMVITAESHAVTATTDHLKVHVHTSAVLLSTSNIMIHINLYHPFGSSSNTQARRDKTRQRTTA